MVSVTRTYEQTKYNWLRDRCVCTNTHTLSICPAHIQVEVKSAIHKGNIIVLIKLISIIFLYRWTRLSYSREKKILKVLEELVKTVKEWARPRNAEVVNLEDTTFNVVEDVAEDGDEEVPRPNQDHEQMRFQEEEPIIINSDISDYEELPDQEDLPDMSNDLDDRDEEAPRPNQEHEQEREKERVKNEQDPFNDLNFPGTLSDSSKNLLKSNQPLLPDQEVLEELQMIDNEEKKNPKLFWDIFPPQLPPPPSPTVPDVIPSSQVSLTDPDAVCKAIIEALPRAVPPTLEAADDLIRNLSPERDESRNAQYISSSDERRSYLKTQFKLRPLNFKKKVQKIRRIIGKVPWETQTSNDEPEVTTMYLYSDLKKSLPLYVYALIIIFKIYFKT